MSYAIKKGLDIPVSGAPENRIAPARPVSRVAVLGNDFIGMKPSMDIAEGDTVKLGQTLFTDKKNPGVRYTSPGGGKIESIVRGPRRVLQAVIIKLDKKEQAEEFKQCDSAGLADLPADEVRENLVASGMWAALRTRPYSKCPAIDTSPHAIFVTAMDSNPLAGDPATIIAHGREQDFLDGLTLLAKLTEGAVYVCKAAGAKIPVSDDKRIRVEQFSGPHPAGLAGTHIHFLDPVNASKTVWTIGYQDVIAIGKLFTDGRLFVDRVVSLAGPMVRDPRLVETRMGADLEDLVTDELEPIECRVISGSIFNGHHAHNWARFLGRYHNQVSVLAEGRERELLGWIAPGKNKFSATRAFLSSVIKPERFKITTTQNGSPRAMVPIGIYEKIMPLRMLPTQLLRSILVRDTDTAVALGCLELDEEDLALCSFVCPGKYDYGPALRKNLEIIEKEG